MNTVKPKAPRNLTVKKIENGNFILSWDKSYQESSFLHNKLSFEVTYYNKRNANKNHIKRHNQLDTYYEILTSELDAGDHVAKVRSLPNGYQGQWSEWSSEVQWHKKSELSLPILQINVLIFSIVTMALIVLSYVCCITHKRKWWNNIPDPAKSSFAVRIFSKSQSSALRKRQCICDQEIFSHETLKHKRNNLMSWLAKYISFSLGENCLHEGNTQAVDKCGADNCRGKSKAGSQRVQVLEKAERTLIPERALVEKLEICPLEAATTALLFEEDSKTMEDKGTEESKENNTFLVDFCIQDLFLNLLGSDPWQPNSETFVDNYKLCNSPETENVKQEIYRIPDQQSCSTPWSFFMEDFPLEQNYSTTRKNFVPSIKSLESNHCGYKSNTLYLKQKSHVDLLHQSSAPQCSDIWEMLGSQRVSEPEIFGGGSGGFTYESDIFIDADYHSFDGAVSKSENRPVPVACCPENMAFDLISSQGGKELAFLMPTRGLHETAYPKVSSSVSPANSTILNMSGYQSFDNAVKQDEMQNDKTVSYGSQNRTIPEESGYKPFDCASLQSSYTESSMGSPKLYPGKDLECECSNSRHTVFFNETYQENETNYETVNRENQSDSLDNDNQHHHNSQAIYDTQNKRTLDGNSNKVYALTFDICDHLKNFGNSGAFDPLLSKEIGSLSSLVKLAEGLHLTLSDIARLSLLQPKSRLEAVMTKQAMAKSKSGLRIPSLDFPPLQKDPLPFLKSQTKFENISYFIQPCYTETVLDLKHNHVPPLDESNSIKHYMMELKEEEEDSEGNFYMEVTSQVDLYQLETIQTKRSHPMA